MSKKNDPDLFSTPPGSRENNDALYPRVVAGDEDAIREMIESNAALVELKVKAFLLHFPNFRRLKDDLLAQGHLAVVEATRGMVGNAIPSPNPTGKINQEIYFALGHLMDHDPCVRVPRRTVLDQQAIGQEITIPRKESGLDSVYTRDRDGQNDPRSLLELHDEILGCCETENERQIVSLRVEGRSDAEIATILGLPKTTTYMLRRGIYARFLQRNPEMTGEV